MIRPLAALLFLAAACGNTDNAIVGGLAGGATTPEIYFDSIGSSIHGTVTLSDANGNPVGDPMAVVIMSNRSNLCSRLQAKRDYFRNPTEVYEALILIVRSGYLGMFIVGRNSDPGTAAEIVAVRGPQTPTPLHAITSSYISITNWPSGAGQATGSFNLLMDDPYGTGTPHPFYGRFKTNYCPTLDGTLLP
jgi:hypothetical protein